MEGCDVRRCGAEGVERGLLLFNFGLQDVGRVGLADIGELTRGLGGIRSRGGEMFARLHFLLEGERGVELLPVGFDALLLRRGASSPVRCCSTITSRRRPSLPPSGMVCWTKPPCSPPP